MAAVFPLDTTNRGRNGVTYQNDAQKTAGLLSAQTKDEVRES